MHDPKTEWPFRFAIYYDGYLSGGPGTQEGTIKNHERYLSRFLSPHPHTVNSLKALVAEHLQTAFKGGDMSGSMLSTVRCILTFLFETRVTDADLSVWVPSPRKPEPLQSIYTGAEIEQLLSAINRATYSGKPDYTILMLTTYTGLRSADKTIRIVQIKTSNPVTIIFNDNVLEALDDYI